MGIWHHDGAEWSRVIFRALKQEVDAQRDAPSDGTQRSVSTGGVAFAAVCLPTRAEWFGASNRGMSRGMARGGLRARAVDA